MLIGIDASRAAAARRTGTENYSLHLIHELLSLDQAHRFRLYFRQIPPPELFPGHAETRVIPFPRLWTHARLSWEMLQEPPDLLFVPSHVLPLVHPALSVVTVHDLGYHYHPEAHTLFQNVYLRWSTRFNARTASHIVADSEATRRDLGRYYDTPPEKVTVVYPGWDQTLSPVEDTAILRAVQARYRLSRSYLLYLGTLQPRKNLVRLVQAFGRLWRGLDGEAKGQCPDLQLVLAGKKGWFYDDIIAAVRREDLEGRILLTGYVPDADLAALLSGALAFVYPSLYEGFGLPVLEAMACGTAVVCSKAASLPEVAGDAAILVDPLDIEGLTTALARVVYEEDLRQELVCRGFRQTAKFSWRRCAEETLAVLEEVGRGVS
jgi:glycosyltransferase involved in cell wall biosynthesis